MTEESKSRPEWRTAANIVTMVRIVLIPVFVVAILAPWPSLLPAHPHLEAAKPWVAALIFALLACTDGIDGYLARSRNEVTTMGKFLDPIADKLLVVAALLALIQLGSLPAWIGIVIIAREFLVSGLRMIAAAENKVIAASWIGKWKTGVSIVAIIMFIIKDSSLISTIGSGFAFWFNILSWAVMVAALVLTIVSMVDYFMKSASILGLGPNRD